MIKIWRSWKSKFGEFLREFDPKEEEAWDVAEVYTDRELEAIREQGFNAIWVHVQLNHIVRTDIFPELGTYAEEFQRRLNLLIGRAEKHGIKVYFYMQIPRGLPAEHPLWKSHPECGGLPDLYEDNKEEKILMIPMCTSVPLVGNYLREASRELARKIPHIAGVILITASEYPSHCYGRAGRIKPDGTFAPVDCPRCTQYAPGEIIVNVLHYVSNGIHEIQPSVKVVAWNWSWNFFEESPCVGILRKLPRDVELLVDFECGGHLPEGTPVEEYSISYAGPSERFLETCSEAAKCGKNVYAKLQLGTTHELAVVPNLPLIGNIRRKALNLLKAKAAGFMGCWNFGNMPSANVAAFQYFFEHPDAGLESFAKKYFSDCAETKVAGAWRKFAEAMQFFPFCNSWLYYGPMNFSPAVPLNPGPLSGIPGGRSWLSTPVRGDDIGKAFTAFTPDETIEKLDRLVILWDEAVELLRSGLFSSRTVHAEEELSSALAAGLLFRSSLHFVQAYRLKSSWTDASMKEWLKIACVERENLKKLLSVVESDPRIGYHIEAHEYLFTEKDVRGKIQALSYFLNLPSVSSNATTALAPTSELRTVVPTGSNLQSKAI